MYIEQIQVSNFRKFENFTLELDKKLNVLIGKNGTGKSSVLEAISIAAGTFFFSLNAIPSVGIRASDSHKKYFVLGDDIDVQKQFPIKISATGNVFGKKIQWTRSLNSDDGKTTSGSAKEMTEISSDVQERIMKGDQTLILPLIAYYGTGRLWDDHREKKSGIYKQNSRINGYIDCLDGRANVKLLLGWFKRMSIKNGQSGRPSETYLAVKGAMETCFRKLTGMENVNVLVNPDTFEIEIKYYENETEAVLLPLSQLSDGYRCALSMIGDIAYRMATLNPQLSGEVLKKTEGIVLIDEVDLHLHPEWQQLILMHLTEIFPGIQFIVTTHAPSVINSIPKGSLIILENSVPDYLGNTAYGHDVNMIVKSYMNTSVRPKVVRDLLKKNYDMLS